jgi:glyoxylase-like metal-dependent hydrolase (beta-lactamase superfamily II)
MSKFLTFNLGISNVFLLKTSDGYILIDTFYKSGLKRFKKKLEKNGIEPEEIKLIIITHTHGDHTGCVKEVQEMTKAKVLVHENEKEFLMKGTTPEVVPVSKPLKLLLPLMPEKVNRYEPVTPDIVVKDSYSLKNFGIDAKVISTPGHTIGSISVIDKKGNAFVGDLVMGFPMNISPGLPKIAVDMDQVLKSWKKLLKEGAKNIHISHGKSFSREALQKKLTQKRFEQDIDRILDSQKSTS